MKIGIISSGNETLSLLKILNRYDNEYLIYCDQTGFPYGQKSLSFVEFRIKVAIEFLKNKGVEIIIVDPIYELLLKNKESIIMPLFSTYLDKYAFKYSLVGKLGVMSEIGELSDVQKLLEEEQKKYNPEPKQISIKKFSYPFHYRVKQMSSWTFNIEDLGIHNPYLIRTMKNDLRYFKDANVDTILPMHYNYFWMQRSIKSFFNFKKTRFHDLLVLDECFKQIVGDNIQKKYSVSVWTNQSSSFIMNNQKLLWLMKRGELIKIEVEECQ